MVNFEVVELGNSSQPVIVRGRGRNKKVWNAKEEATLIDVLLVMNDTSWKTDNGYKNGYSHFIEQQMEEKLPGCGLKADPHIESKIKIFKRYLGYILDMDDKNDEFWWDDEQKMVVGDKEAYLSWAKAKNHGGASALFMRPFVHFDKLCEIFGKTKSTRKRMRVTQALAVDPPIAHVKSLEAQSNVREEATSITQSTITPPCSETGNEKSMRPREFDPPIAIVKNLEAQLNAREEATSITHSTITPPSSETGNEKSKRLREFDPSEMELLEMSKTIRSLAVAQKDLNLSVMNMRKVSTHDVEISEQRKKLFSVLTNLPGLSPIEVVKAARSIGQDDRKVEVFFSMPDDYKLIFAHLEINASDEVHIDC